MARPGLEKHVKFKMLVRLLGEPKPHVRGYLETLWDVAYENGDSFIGDAAAVEAAAEYPGEPGKLCRALAECGGQRRTTADNGAAPRAGFIEEVENQPETYRIHDLFDHAPEYVKKRLVRENERKSKGIGKNGGQRRTTAEIGRTPAPAPAPAPNLESAIADSAEPAKRQASVAPSEFSFPIDGKGPKTWTLPAAKLHEYAEAFPHLDVPDEIRRAVQWCRDNPTNRKTAGGMLKFLTGWLNRSQNRRASATGPRPMFDIDAVDLGGDRDRT